MKKVNIPPEKLIQLYNKQYLTTAQIAKIYSVDRTTISHRLKEYNIASNPSQRKYRIPKTTPLSKLQINLIVGSTLGDGSIICSGRRKNAYFKIAHCEKQKDYLIWKKDILNNLVNKINKQIDKRGNSIMYSFNTLSHQELNLFRELFYQNNQKIIKDELSDYLTPMGLAAWFMDDGSKTGCNYRFATDGFSEEDNYKLQAILKKKFDLNVRVLEYKKYHYLFLNKQNTIKMTEIIKPFIVGCMKYKLIEPVTPGS